ncbi:MAG: T9SS type A sorting domain-containing protein [bacterium]|nr:T9SS type A sorting domain-containing protein [bacterium]
MKKAFLLVLLLTVVSLAQAQSGRWRHITQINPDTINTWDCKLINTGNQLWAIWQEGYSYNDTIAMLYFSKYDGNSWAMIKSENTGYFNFCTVSDVQIDAQRNARLYIYYGESTLKTPNFGAKLWPWGVYTAHCPFYADNWSSLASCYEWYNLEEMKLTISRNNEVFILSQDHMHVSSGQGSGIYSHIYDTTWAQKIEASFDDGMVINHGSPSITVDKNDSLWKGWCSTQYYTLPGDVPNWVTINNNKIDTNSTTAFGDLQLCVDSLNKIWAFYTSDSIRCRVNENGTWQPIASIGAGSYLKSVVDKSNNIWLACRKDSIIYVNFYNQSNWGNWDSITVGWLQHLSLDQMGNPCLAWGHNGNIYSGVYCRDTLAPTVSITSPAAGSEYTEGQQVPVHCTYSSDAAFLNIYCRRSGSSDWQKLFDMVPVDSSMNWTVPNDSSDYSFKAEAIDSGWNTSLDSTGWFAVKPLGVQGAPSEQAKIAFGLRNSGPNPFKRSAVINYQLPQDGPVQIKVYNANGQLVKTTVNASQNAGAYTARWNGNNEQNVPASAGVYICRLMAAGQTASVKLIKLK